MVDWDRELIAFAMATQLFGMLFGASIIISNSLSKYPFFGAYAAGAVISLLGGWGFCRIIVKIIEKNSSNVPIKSEIEK